MRALLVSPGPLDGYPPVANQARLLADAGLMVKVLSLPLPWRAELSFSHPGVEAVLLPDRGLGGVGAVLRAIDFSSAIARERIKHPDALVEVAYDPLGVFYSDLAPRGQSYRVAHFHECLQRVETAWIERRLRRASSRYDLLVTADGDRSAILEAQLGASERPISVPNYPLRSGEPTQAADRERFDVVYCGAVGYNQKLDLIIRSVALWPPSASFSIIGNAETPTGRELRSIAENAGVVHRVRFEGWIPYEGLTNRLCQSDLGILFLDPSLEQFRTALGASNKRYQYMQAGLPQLGDRNPGVAELLEGQKIGRCISSYSPEAIAEAVRSYVDAPERRRAEGARAYELHRDKYNYERAFQPVLDWILSLPREPKAR